METRCKQSILHIFNVIKADGHTTEKALGAVFSLKWKSNRECARTLGISHTAVNRILSGASRSGPASELFFSELGIENPWFDEL